jgi:ABC-2 type transport system permease protein
MSPERASTNAYEVSQRPGPLRRVGQVWRYRELLVNLTRKELKVKYKDSFLGFLWSLLNPLLYLVVFSIVFQGILGSAIPLFSIFLLSGLLAWNLFSTSLAGATGSIVGNAPLVQKVWFPREILPLAAIGASMIHFFLQLIVLAVALLAFQHQPAWLYLPLVLPALMVLLLWSAAIGVGLAAINVYMRDTQHLLELVILAWFWFTAIVYPLRTVTDKLGEYSNLVFLNPMVIVVLTFQRAIYNPDPGLLLETDKSIAWFAGMLAISGLVALCALVGALLVFGRLEDNLGEEI